MLAMLEVSNFQLFGDSEYLCSKQNSSVSCNYNENHIFIIKGNGQMVDYSDSSTVPWR